MTEEEFKKKCQWSYEYVWLVGGIALAEEKIYWETNCGKNFIFFENKFNSDFKFCFSCGRQIGKKIKKKLKFL